jgi:hypothetical protein
MRRLFVLLLALSLGVVSLGVAGAQDEKVLVVGLSEDYHSLDPSRAYEPGGSLVHHSVYDTLVTFPSDSVAEILPNLAASWTVSDDGLVYTFTLRDDVTFSNGDELTAEDVVFSFNRMKNLKDNPSFLADTIASVEAADDLTFVMTLTQPDPAILAKIIFDAFSVLNADEVRASLPAYGLKVDSVIAQMGRQHPLVKTQYFCEEIDAQAGMFNANRLALMQGDQPAQTEPLPGHAYAFCIDVAGMDESLLNLEGLGNPGRDCTTLSVVEVDLSALATLHAPIYRVVKRLSWQGANHLVVLGQVSALASIWNPQHVVIDATGVGEGLWALLDRALPGRVMPVKFSQQKKSELGYAFLGIIETGRFRDCARTDDVLLQYQNCQSEILPGPQHTLRWGVPDGQRGPGGMLLHDDYILADALTAELDSLDWTPFVPSGFVEADDPLKWMDGNF